MKLSNIILESDETVLGSEIAKAMEAEFGQEGADDVNEIITTVGVLSWALASNTVLDVLGKYAAKAFRKGGFDKAADKAEAVHKWAHHNEVNIVKAIGGFLKPFVKDEKKRQLVAKGLFIAMLAGLGVKAGIGAMNALRGGGIASATISAVKAALKGRDIAVVAGEIAKAVGVAGATM
jgi:hypothetical protein|tara:strand:- start:2474 stop:3007 length:534 start_codon:yes stop_codon:yes gene_type:complete